MIDVLVRVLGLLFIVSALAIALGAVFGRLPRWTGLLCLIFVAIGVVLVRFSDVTSVKAEGEISERGGLKVSFEARLAHVPEGKAEDVKLVDLLDADEQKSLREQFPLGWAVFYTDGRRMAYQSDLPSDLDLRWADTQFLPSIPSEPDLVMLTLPTFHPAKGIEIGDTKFGLPKDLNVPLILVRDTPGRRELIVMRLKSKTGEHYWVVGATKF